MSLRLLMMGTGTFALPTFQTLIDSKHDVVGLVTQPDRTGRGHHRHVNPMKEAALHASVTVFQPEKVNAPNVLEQLRELNADVFVVAAYGQLLSAELLGIPRLCAINLHASLLPKYRGAAPIQYAVWCGERETGITIFEIQPKLDAGPILGTVSTEIGSRETSGELHDRLAELAPALTIDVLHGLESGTIAATTQDPELVTRAPRIRKEQGLIDWTKPSTKIQCQIRAMQPWPMPFSFLHVGGEKVIRLLVLDVEPIAESMSGEVTQMSPGFLKSTDDGRLIVRTGDGALEIMRLQPAGKRPMSAADFLRGRSVEGGFLGRE